MEFANEEMKPTEKEIRYYLRSRTKWHRAFRCTRNILALMFIGTFVLFQVLAFMANADRDSYEARAAQLRTGEGPDSLPTHIIPADFYASDFALISDCYRAYKQEIDAMQLSDKQLGFTFSVTVLPIGLKGYRSCSSEMNVLTTACGCEEDSVDVLALVMDSTLQHASVVSSRKIALAGFKNP